MFQSVKQWFLTGDDLAMSRDILGCHNWGGLLAYSGQRPGILLNNPH